MVNLERERNSNSLRDKKNMQKITKEDLLKLYKSSPYIKKIAEDLDTISHINGFSGSQMAFFASAKAFSNDSYSSHISP